MMFAVIFKVQRFSAIKCRPLRIKVILQFKTDNVLNSTNLMTNVKYLEVGVLKNIFSNCLQFSKSKNGKI